MNTPTSRRSRHPARVAACIACVLVASCAATAEGPRGQGPREDVKFQILAINDFHGNLAPPSGSSGRVGSVEAGGAEFLATHIARLRAEQPGRSFVVSAGDLIGASPLLSGLFHDEPTIEAMNAIGLDFNAVGNHEFDEGVTELLRMQNGGCHPVDGCLDSDGFAGAGFQFLAANVERTDNAKSLFPRYAVRAREGVKLGFMGLTLEGTPAIVAAAGIAGWSFLDEAESINRLVPELRAKGVETLVVLIHEGGLPAATDPNGCAGVSGPIVDIVDKLDPAIDLVISGHTHQAYVCRLGRHRIPTTSAFSFGRLITDIDLTIDRQSGDVRAMSIGNLTVTRDVPRDPLVTALIDRYAVAAAPIANRAIGRIASDISRKPADTSRENALGNAIADAQLFASTSAGARLAFMNPGGVRADLSFASSPAGEGDGAVTYGELFTVQPFGNGLLTMTLTGAQLDALLEQQFCGINSPANGGFFRVLLPSAGLHYTYRESATGTASCAAANAVDPAGITLDGVPVEPAHAYRVTVNTFLADGGDGFSVLREGADRVGGPVDTDAFEAYLAASAAAGLSAPATDRIDVVP